MTERSIFVDTGAWLALADMRDQYHQKAQTHLDKLDSEGATFVTTNLVLHETADLLSRRASRQAATKFLDTVNKNERVSITYSGEITEQKAYDIFNKYTDQDFSITDCVSFIIMKQLHLKRAFSFDKHFSIMGFTIEPL